MTSPSPIQRSALPDTMPLLGKGGFSRVYLLVDGSVAGLPGACAYKEYKRSAGPIPLKGLQRVVDIRTRTDAARQVLLDSASTWPHRVVVDGPALVVGVVMPLIDEGYFQDIVVPLTGERKRVAREVQHLFAPPERLVRKGMEAPDVSTRLAICQRAAFLIGVLHKMDVIYGDLSGKNFLYRLDPKPAVLLVDCDAVRVKGTAAIAGSQPHTPDWIPPECVGRRDVQSVGTDRWKLAALILRLLSAGPGGSVTLDPVHADRILGPEGQDLLRRGLSATPEERPTAKDWVQFLEKLRSGSKTTTGVKPTRTPAPVATTPRPKNVTGRYVRDPDRGWVEAP